ncbi:hypothetical protein OG767_18950 [Micromonospora sp. NBC_01392]|uniref:hypothetical protein n=1 Tax=Micromonospora sp. NBC_01392 TaxID=2903588 RepID=UPI00324F0E81
MDHLSSGAPVRNGGSAGKRPHTTGDVTEAHSQGPVGSARALAIVHLAMHDAYVGLTGAYEPWLGDRLPEPPADAEPDNAVAAAARTTLAVLHPAQRAFFEARHLAAGLVAGKHGGSDPVTP